MARVGERRNHASVVLIHLFLITLSLVFLVPIWAIISISISSEADIANVGYRLVPSRIDWTAYQLVFRNPDEVLSAYRVTTITSSIALLLYLSMASMCAYALSRMNFKFRKHLTFYLFFTMLFSGGIIPVYILMTRYLGLRNTYAALILPLLGGVWHIFIFRTFFQQLPFSLVESAKMDGASEFMIYFRIILPLSTPVFATLGFINLLNFWNQWFPSLLYTDEPELLTLQYLLQIMLRNMIELTRNMDEVPQHMLSTETMPVENVRMAMSLIAAGPVLFIFPLFQRYFTKGLTIGSVKG